MSMLVSLIISSCKKEMTIEIVLRTINGLESGMNWLKSSFLHVRMLKNPSHYCYTKDSIKDLVEKMFWMLTKYDMISESDGIKKSTMVGEAMAKYYLRYDTMANITRIPFAPSIDQLVLSIRFYHCSIM